jgi:predicted secreted protein
MSAMKTWRPIILGLSLAAGSASAASAFGHAGKAIILTEQTAGAVKARVGQAVEIRLRSQPGTGFSWSPKNDAAKLKALPPIQAQAIPGGWQTQRFRFLARRPGTYRLTFSYDRPWKGGEKGARTIAFTIKAR